MEIENAALQGDLAHLTSYEVMSDRADRAGYELSAPESTDYIVVEGYTGVESPRLASNLRPAFTQEEAGLPPEYTESIFSWVKKILLEKSVRAMEEIP